MCTVSPHHSSAGENPPPRQRLRLLPLNRGGTQPPAASCLISSRTAPPFEPSRPHLRSSHAFRSPAGLAYRPTLPHTPVTAAGGEAGEGICARAEGPPYTLAAGLSLQLWAGQPGRANGCTAPSLLFQPQPQPPLFFPPSPPPRPSALSWRTSPDQSRPPSILIPYARAALLIGPRRVAREGPGLLRSKRRGEARASE